MPRLDITLFTDALLPLVSDFDCGPLTYQQEVADWIRGQGVGTVLDAIHSRRRPTLVWLYSTPQDGIVGYGSLCRSAWSTTPNGPRDRPISLIPNVGLRTRFQRYPPDAERDDRYSSQMMRHLIHEARQYPPEDRLPLLGLFVHPDNIAGRKLYERMGFRDFPQTYSDEGVIYQGMLLRLALTEATDGERAEEEAVSEQQNDPL